MRWTDQQLDDAIAFLTEHGLVERVVRMDGEVGYQATAAARRVSDEHPTWTTVQIARYLREAIDEHKEAHS